MDKINNLIVEATIKSHDEKNVQLTLNGSPPSDKIVFNDLITRVPAEAEEMLYLVPNLKRLALAGCNLFYIPNVLFAMVGLEVLDLGNNHITHIPKEIENLGTLEEISVAKNKLCALPETLYALQKLKKLDISFNNIMRISPDIKKLNILEYLDVSNNKLSELPEELFDLTGLTTLKIGNFPIFEFEKHRYANSVGLFPALIASRTIRGNVNPNNNNLTLTSTHEAASNIQDRQLERLGGIF